MHDHGNGGYAWAKYGFYPLPATWNVLKRKLKRGLEFYSNLYSFSASEMQRINAILDSNNPKRIWDIADLDRHLTTRTVGEREVNITVGKQLLLGENWNGEIDLTNSQALSRLLEYIGMAQ